MTEAYGDVGANISALVSVSGAGQLPVVKYLIEEARCNIELGNSLQVGHLLRRQQLQVT